MCIATLHPHIDEKPSHNIPIGSADVKHRYDGSEELMSVVVIYIEVIQKGVLESMH